MHARTHTHTHTRARARTHACAQVQHASHIDSGRGVNDPRCGRCDVLPEVSMIFI